MLAIGKEQSWIRKRPIQEDYWRYARSSSQRGQTETKVQEILEGEKWGTRIIKAGVKLANLAGQLLQKNHLRFGIIEESVRSK